MGASYIYSMIVSVAEQLLIVAILVAVFLFLLQLIKYFKNRNSELTAADAAPAQQPAAPCCAQPAAAAEPEAEAKDTAE